MERVVETGFGKMEIEFSKKESSSVPRTIFDVVSQSTLKMVSICV